MSLEQMLQILALLGGVSGAFVGLSILAGIAREYRFGYQRSESRSTAGVRISADLGVVIAMNVVLGGITTIFTINSQPSSWFQMLKMLTVCLLGATGISYLWLGRELWKNEIPNSTCLWGFISLLIGGVIIGIITAKIQIFFQNTPQLSISIISTTIFPKTVQSLFSRRIFDLSSISLILAALFKKRKICISWLRKPKTVASDKIVFSPQNIAFITMMLGGILLGFNIGEYQWYKLWENHKNTWWIILEIVASGLLLLELKGLWSFWKENWEKTILSDADQMRSTFVFFFALVVEVLLLFIFSSVIIVLIVNQFSNIHQPLNSSGIFIMLVFGILAFLVFAYYYIFLLGPISEHGRKVLLCRQDGQQWRVWLMDEDKRYYYIATSQARTQQAGCNIGKNAPKVVIMSLPKEEIRKITFLSK